MKKKTNYFTLIEILSVVLIIVLLMSIVAGLFKLANSKVKNAEQMSLMKQIETALEAYRTKLGYYIPETNPPYQSQRVVTGNYGSVKIDPFPFYILYLDSSGTQGKQTFASYFPNYENIREKYSIKHDLAFLDANGDGKPDYATTSHQEDGYELKGQGGQMKFPGVLLDAWGNKMWYRCPGIHNKTKYDLESAGPDGVFGYTTKFEDDYDCTKDENKWHKTPAHPDFAADNINNWSR